MNNGGEWDKYWNFTRNEMYDNTRINETVQGSAAPRQSAVAKNIEIEQALSVWFEVISNYNMTWVRLQELKCSLIAYFYDRNMVISEIDEKGNAKVSQEINVPVWDAEGNETVFNDVTGHRYKWTINPVDDSPTAKARAMEDAIAFLNAAGGPLASLGQDFLAKFMKSMPNFVLSAAGVSMEESAKQMSESTQAKEAEKMRIDAVESMAKAQAMMIGALNKGFNVSVSSEDLMKYPALMQLYQQRLMALNSVQPSSGQEMAQQPPQENMVGNTAENAVVQ
jgi:hypothetical protein